MPPSVERGGGKRLRVDYFDSKLQVLRSLRDKGAVVVEVADESQPDPVRSSWRQPASAPSASHGPQAGRQEIEKASEALERPVVKQLCARGAGHSERRLPARPQAPPQQFQVGSEVVGHS